MYVQSVDEFGATKNVTSRRSIWLDENRLDCIYLRGFWMEQNSIPNYEKHTARIIALIVKGEKTEYISNDWLEFH